jgi:large conductance mechanosensitive channel
MLQEFKKFALRGNVLDLAVAVVIGAAFGKIVSSLVADVIMPVVGLIVGGVDFADLVVVLKAATADTPAVTLGYGKLIQTIVDFIIVAFAIFLFVKLYSRLKAKEEAAPAAPPPPPEPSAEEKLLTEIRDLLKKS